MGWDVLILKLKDPATSPMELAESNVQPLGTPDVIRAAIDGVLKGVDWTDPEWGVLRLDACVLEFNLKVRDPLHIGVHVHGGGDPVGPIVALCKANGWVALDTTTTTFLDLEQPSHDGWNQFRGFRDRAIRHLNGETDEP